MAFSFIIGFGTYSAEAKNDDLVIQDNFDDNKINTMWDIVYGLWEEESKLIHSKDYFIPNEKFLYLDKNISGYKYYEIAIDIKKAPLEYSNEYTDGGFIIGTNLTNCYEVYLDTSNKSFKMYKYNGEVIFNEQISSLTQSGTYRIELSVNQDRSGYDGTIRLKDETNKILFTKTLNDIPLKFNKFYLYSKSWKWSAFDNFSFYASKDASEINAPSDFSSNQIAGNIEFNWTNPDDTSAVSQLELVYSNEEITDTSNVTIIDSNINKNATHYTKSISALNGLDYGNDYFFGIRSVKVDNKGNKTYSDYVTDDIYLLAKPQSPIYAEYDGKIEIIWNASPGAYKYFLKSGTLNIGEATENKYVINKPISNTIDLTKLNITAFRDGNYSEASTYATKVDVKKVGSLEVWQNGSLHNLNWSALTGATGYEIYSGYNSNSLVKVGEVVGTSYIFDVLRNGQLIDEYGVERYFAIKPIMGPEELTEFSDIVSVVLLDKPKIIQSPLQVINNTTVSIDDTLVFNVSIDKKNVLADLVVQLGSLLKLESTDLGSYEDMGNNTYRIRLGNTDIVNGTLSITPKVNNSSESVINNFTLYTEGYTFSGNERILKNLTEKETSLNIIIGSVSSILEGEFGVVDRSDQENVVISEEPISVYFGEKVNLKSFFTINGSIYDPIIKYTFKNNELFKFTFPEPSIEYKSQGSDTISKFDYKADFIITGDVLTVIVRPIIADNVLHPGEIGIDIITDIIPKDINEVKIHIDDSNYYIRKLPYEIESKIPEMVKRSLDARMQILFNTKAKEIRDDNREFQSGEKKINLELTDIPTIPNVF